jgi:hypothetical protein
MNVCTGCRQATGPVPYAESRCAACALRGCNLKPLNTSCARRFECNTDDALVAGIVQGTHRGPVAAAQLARRWDVAGPAIVALQQTRPPADFKWYAGEDGALRMRLVPDAMAQFKAAIVDGRTVLSTEPAVCGTTLAGPSVKIPDLTVASFDGLLGGACAGAVCPHPSPPLTEFQAAGADVSEWDNRLGRRKIAMADLADHLAKTTEFDAWTYKHAKMHHGTKQTEVLFAPYPSRLKRAAVAQGKMDPSFENWFYGTGAEMHGSMQDMPPLPVAGSAGAKVTVVCPNSVAEVLQALPLSKDASFVHQGGNTWAYVNAAGMHQKASATDWPADQSIKSLTKADALHVGSMSGVTPNVHFDSPFGATSLKPIKRGGIFYYDDGRAPPVGLTEAGATSPFRKRIASMLEHRCKHDLQCSLEQNPSGCFRIKF